MPRKINAKWFKSGIPLKPRQPYTEFNVSVPNTLFISAMGRAECRRADGSLVTLPTRHCLLALVALSTQPMSRAELGSILWPLADPREQRNNLRSALPHLRRALPTNGLLEQGDVLKLKPGLVVVDAWAVTGHEDFAGDFLPGFEQDWAIEQRLEIRQVAYESALECARDYWAKGNLEQALKLAKRAVEIDPLQDEAAEVRVTLLEKLGQRAASLTIADAHRSKVLRELGSVSHVRPSIDTRESHPLIAAAEWLLEFNPENLISLLASTHHEWLALPVRAALEIHERALATTTGGNATDRNFLEAQRIVLLVQAGQLGAHRQRAEAALQSALTNGEHLTATRLAGALSYGYLSIGGFGQSLQYAELAAATSEKVADPLTRFESQYLHTIISAHVGNTEESTAKTLDHLQRIDEVPSEMVRAGICVSSIESLITCGKVDQASRQLEHARRVFSAAGVTRHVAWVHLSNALICSATGDHAAACASIQETVNLGWRTAGHSAISMAEDRLAQTYCNMRRYELAAEAFVRSARFRQKLGTVPSVLERAVIERTKATLFENLGEPALRKLAAMQAS